jgi:hypothetical protein
MRNMIEAGRSRWLACALGLVLIASCSKGASSIDEDAARAEELNNDEGEKDPICGNGIINDEVREDCDGNALGGVTCVTLGFTGGTLTCDPQTCAFDTTMCTLPNPGGGGSGG